MVNKIAEYFTKGFLFTRNNPQIIYTIFLIIVIPVAFILSGQQFLSVAKSNQERLEKERVGVMQDIFVELASRTIYASSSLQTSIENIKNQNKDSIAGFKVVLFENGKQKIVASADKTEVGNFDDENAFYYNEGGMRGDVSRIFPVSQNGVRHWKVVRGISDSTTGAVVGASLIDVSMSSIDESSTRNIEEAYIVLFFIVLAISILLLRQARILDYTVLYQKLQEVDQMKDDFISMATHELRTPLTIVKGYAELLGTSKDLKDDDKESISRIKVSIDQLGGLISDILDVIRLGQGKMVFRQENLNIAPILEKVVDSFQYVAHEKGLEISYEKKDVPLIYIDAEKLRQVVVNIVGNAIKYTHTGSVKIFVEVDRETVFIRVRDTGVGISAEDQKKLFEKFFRARTKETEDIQGTGLGLWIAGQVVVNLGGRIAVESIKGKGTDVIISFPLVKEIKKMV